MTDRQPNASLPRVDISNRSHVAEQREVLELDPADWESGGNPDWFKNAILCLWRFLRGLKAGYTVASGTSESGTIHLIFNW